MTLVAGAVEPARRQVVSTAKLRRSLSKFSIRLIASRPARTAAFSGAVGDRP